jgi:hypothetical protein
VRSVHLPTAYNTQIGINVKDKLVGGSQAARKAAKGEDVQIKRAVPPRHKLLLLQTER